MNKEVLVHIYNEILAIKRNEMDSVVVSWINLESITQSEVIQKKKNKYCIVMHIYGI